MRSLSDGRAHHIDLHLFYNGPMSLDIAIAAGIDAVLVDCEEIGKRTRQHGFDTEINCWRPRDCESVRERSNDLRVICRIDSFRGVGRAAIDQAREAVNAGADEVLLPMVDQLDQVQQILDVVAGRAEVGVMIETEWAVRAAAELDRLPLKRAFIGLNDLMIERRSPHLFQHLLDGTVEQIRSQLKRIALGFGGLTLPERGYPVPGRLLMAELARQRSNFTFLRRSFYRDLAATGLAPDEMVTRIRDAWEKTMNRPDEVVATDHDELQKILQQIVTNARS